MEVDDKNRTDQEKINSEYEQFLKDLEENPELRFNISLYRNKDYQPSEMTSVADGDDLPSIPLDELLADLDLSKAEAEDEDDEMKEWWSEPFDPLSYSLIVPSQVHHHPSSSVF